MPLTVLSSSDREDSAELVQGYSFLLAGLAQRLHADRVRGGFIGPDQQGVTRARGIGSFHLRLEAAAANAVSVKPLREPGEQKTVPLNELRRALSVG